jgi:SEC-C motif-containing protein
MTTASEPCPCGSAAAYATCCAPYHQGEREPADATALMRSRYAAFATKNVDYLWRTLHADHDDRARPEAQVRRELRDACSANRYLGLRVLDAQEPDSEGVARVLFAVRVFHRGRDVSFVECSAFAREEEAEGWRYIGGEGTSVAFEAVRETTIEAFLATRDRER